MNIEQRKIIYSQLREFENGVKNVASVLECTEEHVRVVMTKKERHKSSEKITNACLAEIQKRRDAQKEKLRAFFIAMI